MTDGTCGGVDGTLKCAWWTCTVERVKSQTQGVCHCNPKTENKDADDFCSHHVAARGWGDEEQRDPAKPLFAHVMDENARLKARCQEARKVIERTIFYAAEWQGRRDAWLEASDDE